MENVNLSRRLINQNTKLEYNNVTELVIQNYSSTKIDIVLSSIVTEIPPATKVGGIDVPSLPYTISGSGNNIQSLGFDINFPTGNGKVIIDCLSKKC
jgi:hypothetical protein